MKESQSGIWPELMWERKLGCQSNGGETDKHILQTSLEFLLLVSVTMEFSLIVVPKFSLEKTIKSTYFGQANQK